MNGFIRGHKGLRVAGSRLAVRAVLAAAVVLALAVPASASIAVFTDGRSMKIASYKVEDDTIRLTLNGGGAISIPLARIDRIVDDDDVAALPRDACIDRGDEARAP